MTDRRGVFFWLQGNFPSWRDFPFELTNQSAFIFTGPRPKSRRHHINKGWAWSRLPWRQNHLFPKIAMEIFGRVWRESPRAMRKTRARVGSFLFLSHSPSFFHKRFQFPFLASLQFFFCKWNTDEVMSAYKRRLQICFRGGSAAGEQQAPPIEEQRKCTVNSGRCVFFVWSGCQFLNSIFVGAEKDQEENLKRKCMFQERERERERETETETETETEVRVRSAIFFPIRPATSGCRSLWTDKLWPLCAWRFASTGTVTGELDLRCWDWTRTFPQRVDNQLALHWTGKIRWQNVCSNNCFFTLKEKLIQIFRWPHGQAQKFEAQQQQVLEGQLKFLQSSGSVHI